MSKKVGFELEVLACQYLLDQNLQLITRNYSTRFGELDLIMLDGQILVFLEVRYRKNIKYGHPIESITKAKQLKILNTALDFLYHNQQYKNIQYRFDVITILGNITKIRQNFNEYINWHKNFTIEEYGYYN